MNTVMKWIDNSNVNQRVTMWRMFNDYVFDNQIDTSDLSESTEHFIGMCNHGLGCPGFYSENEMLTIEDDINYIVTISDGQDLWDLNSPVYINNQSLVGGVKTKSYTVRHLNVTWGENVAKLLRDTSHLKYKMKYKIPLPLDYEQLNGSHPVRKYEVQEHHKYLDCSGFAVMAILRYMFDKGIDYPKYMWEITNPLGGSPNWMLNIFKKGNTGGYLLKLDAEDLTKGDRPLKDGDILLYVDSRVREHVAVVFEDPMTRFLLVAECAIEWNGVHASSVVDWANEDRNKGRTCVVVNIDDIIAAEARHD